ncbi:MAG: hypothetical protein LJF30_20355 [Acidobacteria bacterium]|nr:hypothetical protein [Acidobacteriota bacterium]
MSLLGTGLLVAFDSGSVSVAVLPRAGRRRVQGFVRSALEPGALVPSPAGPNIIRRDEVKEVLAGALGKLAPGGGKATLFLPDGIARLVMVAPPSGADPRDYLRFRLASSLPWPAADAIVELLPAGRGRVVGAAVRRGTVVQYEQLAASAGLTVERVHLGPLAALGSLLGRGGRSGVHAILGDGAMCLAVIRGGNLVAFRSRRRDPSEGEAERLLAEASRAARLAGDGDGPVQLVLSGSGAGRLREDLGPASTASGGLEGPREWPEAVEAAWLAGALS